MKSTQDKLNERADLLRTNASVTAAQKHLDQPRRDATMAGFKGRDARLDELLTELKSDGIVDGSGYLTEKGEKQGLTDPRREREAREREWRRAGL